MKTSKILLLLWWWLPLDLVAQNDQEPQPFWDEIQAFKKSDAHGLPPAGATLFVGSSSIRLWTDLAEAFPSLKVVNRGFGGSTLEHLLWYLDDIVIPYQAGQIVIYCGENDIATGSVSPQQVLDRMQEVLQRIRRVYPQVPIFFISLKPSISRLEFLDEMRKSNDLISLYLDTQPLTTFIDVFHPMLNEQGDPRPDIFVEDNLHLNAKGYEIWKRVLQPYVSP